MATFTSDGWEAVGELRGLPVSARWVESGWFEFAVLGPEVALEFRRLDAGQPGAGGLPLVVPTWAFVAPHPGGSGYAWVQGYGPDDGEAWEHLRDGFRDSYLTGHGATRRFGYGVGITERYRHNPRYRFSRPELDGQPAASVTSAERGDPLGPEFPGPKDLTGDEVAGLVRLRRSLLDGLDPARAARAAAPDFRPKLAAALVTGGPRPVLAGEVECLECGATYPPEKAHLIDAGGMGCARCNH